MQGKDDLEGFDPLEEMYKGDGDESDTSIDAENKHEGDENEYPNPYKTIAREYQDADGVAHIVLAGDARQVQDAYNEHENRIYNLVPRVDVGLHTRGGRKPKLMRYEVNMIRADGRSTSECAKHYGVSENTIRRVKQQGVYRDIPYIPADEYIRDITMQGNGEGYSVQPSMRERERERKTGERTTVKPIGRPYGSGREGFSNAELIDIASSSRTLRDTAEKYGVSKSTIYNIKKRMRDAFPEGMSDIVQVALNDPRTPKQLAAQYGMSESWFAQVRKDGYAISSDGPITRLKEGDRLNVDHGKRVRLKKPRETEG